MGLPNLPNPCFGPDELGLCLGCCGWMRAWHGAPCAFGLADGIFGPFLYPYQLPPSPCVRTAWARAVIISATVAISTCLLGYGLIKPDRRHTCYVNDGPLGFALVFHTPLVLPCFLPTSPVLSSSGALSSLFYLVSLYFVFSWIFVCPFGVGSFSGVFLLPSHSWARCVSISSCFIFFDCYDEVLRLNRLDFVCPVRSCHEPKSLSAHW